MGSKSGYWFGSIDGSGNDRTHLEGLGVPFLHLVDGRHLAEVMR